MFEQGERCPDLTCPCRLHNHCKRNAFRIEGNNHRCPICKKDWDDALPVGEKAALENRRSTGGVGAATARRSMVNDGADESQEDEDEG